MESGVLAEPVLVGRERELEELQRHLALAIAGKGATVFISGEAGSGKTRLLTEFLRTVDKEATVLAGWCLSDATVPYFPFVEAFHYYFSNNVNDEAVAASQRISLKSWLTQTNQPEYGENPTAAQPQVCKDQAFQEFSKELLFLSTKKPLILALEDIHWADSASLALLHYLARQAGTERILILATFRREELTSDKEGNRNPLSKALLLMGRESIYREVALPNLRVKDVKVIAESMLGGSVHEELVERLTSDSQGNPLFVVESLRMLYQRGTLVEKDGQWSLRENNLRIPPKMRDVILYRLSALKADQRRILDIASVIGEKFDPKLVAVVVSLDNADVLLALNDIVKCTLLLSFEGNCCRFEHAKFREMLYEELPPLLRREFHLRIGEELEGASQLGANVSVSDLAYHFVQAGSNVKAIKYSLQAGKLALSRFSNTEAIRHFTYVLNSVVNDKELINEKVIALDGLGDAFFTDSLYEEAARTFQQLANFSHKADVRLRALRKAMESTFQLGDISKLTQLLKKAEPCAASNHLENAKVLMLKGRAFTLQQMPRASIDCNEAALRVFEEEYSLLDIAECLMAIGTQHVSIGSLEGLAVSLRYCIV